MGSPRAVWSGMGRDRACSCICQACLQPWPLPWAHPTCALLPGLRRAPRPSAPLRILSLSRARRVSYCAIESFGSIFVSLFWSFVNSTVSLEHAKASYGLIIAGAQIGAILGPTLAVMSASFGVANLYAFAGIVVGMVWVLMRKFVAFYGTGGGTPKAAAATAGKGKGAPSLVEGVYLLGRHPYVAGIFFITCLFEVVVTVLDFEMKVIAKAQPQYRDTAAFAAFMGSFGQATNSVSLFFSLVGTSFVIRRLGLPTTLLLFPLMLMGVLSYVFLAPSLDVFFCALVTVKGLSYALNKPSVEMLYFATSDAIKFKSKSWSDVFGSRGAKAAGSLITDGLRCARLPAPARARGRAPPRARPVLTAPLLAAHAAILGPAPALRWSSSSSGATSPRSASTSPCSSSRCSWAASSASCSRRAPSSARTRATRQTTGARASSSRSRRIRPTWRTRTRLHDSRRALRRVRRAVKICS